MDRGEIAAASLGPFICCCSSEKLQARRLDRYFMLMTVFVRECGELKVMSALHNKLLPEGVAGRGRRIVTLIARGRALTGLGKQGL